MRCDFNQPIRLNMNDLSHKFFCCEYKFMIHNKFDSRFKQRWTWMNLSCMLISKCFVNPFILQFSSIIKITWCYRFSYICKCIVFHDAQFLISIINFYSFTKLNKLFLDVSSSFHWSHLNEIFKAPLRWIICFFPLIINYKQSNMVSSWSEEVSLCIVCMNRFFFWSKEYWITDW